MKREKKSLYFSLFLHNSHWEMVANIFIIINIIIIIYLFSKMEKYS